MSECENHVLPHQRDYAWITTWHIHLSGRSQQLAQEDSTHLCRGSGNPFAEDGKTLFMQLVAHSFIFTRLTY